MISRKGITDLSVLILNWVASNIKGFWYITRGVVRTEWTFEPLEIIMMGNDKVKKAGYKSWTAGLNSLVLQVHFTWIFINALRAGTCTNKHRHKHTYVTSSQTIAISINWAHISLPPAHAWFTIAKWCRSIYHVTHELWLHNGNYDEYRDSNTIVWENSVWKNFCRMPATTKIKHTKICLLQRNRAIYNGLQPAKTKIF